MKMRKYANMFAVHTWNCMWPYLCTVVQEYMLYRAIFRRALCPLVFYRLYCKVPENKQR